MKIDETVSKYIGENRQNEYKVWFKTLQDADTIEKLDRAVELAQEYYHKYGENWFSHTFLSDEQTKPTGKLWNRMLDVIKNKKDKLTHIEKKSILDDRM